jgi:hypothetical protein
MKLSLSQNLVKCEFYLVFFFFKRVAYCHAYCCYNYFKSLTLDAVILSFNPNSLKFLHFMNIKV